MKNLRRCYTKLIIENLPPKKSIELLKEIVPSAFSLSESASCGLLSKIEKCFDFESLVWIYKTNIEIHQGIVSNKEYFLSVCVKMLFNTDNIDMKDERVQVFFEDMINFEVDQVTHTFRAGGVTLDVDLNANTPLLKNLLLLCMKFNQLEQLDLLKPKFMDGAGLMMDYGPDELKYVDRFIEMRPDYGWLKHYIALSNKN